MDCKRNLIAEQTDPLAVAQSYVDWARLNLQNFANGVQRQLLETADPNTQDRLLAPLFNLLDAKQRLGRRSR